MVNKSKPVMDLQKENERLRARVMELENRLYTWRDFEDLIIHISSRFVSYKPDETDLMINDALKKICEFVSVDRGSVFMLSDNGEIIANTHEWRAEGIESRIDNLSEFPASGYSWLLGKLRKNENVYIENASSLSESAEAERNILEALDIVSLILVPIRYEGVLHGFLSFGSVREERKWSEKDANLLKIVGNFFAYAIDRKKTLAVLMERENHFTTLAEESPNMIFINLRGKTVYANRRCVEVMGYSKEKFYSPDFDFMNLITDEYKDLVLENFAKHMEAKEIPSCEFDIVSGDGKIINVILTSRLIDYQGGKATLGILTDITNHKEWEQKIIESKEKAESASRLKSEFLRNISHELRTPLNGVIGMISLLKDTDLTGYQRKYLKYIQLSSNNLLRLINEILDFSIIEAGKVRLYRKPFSILELADEVVSMFKVRAVKKGIQLVKDIEGVKDEYLVGDPLEVEQVLVNLMDNAIKFTEKGFVKLKISTEKTNGNKSRLRLLVSDSGIGIPEEDLPHIFESFRQIDGSYTRKYEGVGLGLSIVKSVVDLLNGTIRVESGINLGSRFFVELVFDIGGKQLDTPVPVTGETGNLAKKKKVLVAEDELTNSLYLCELLEKKGYMVEAVSNGKEVVELLEKKYFDLILMDIGMPIMNGIDATVSVREKDRNKGRYTSIIALTAHVYVEDRELCFKAGMDDFLTKPVDKNELFDKIDQYI